MATSKRRRSVPKALPREPLTKKARAAIQKFVELRAAKVGRIGYLMIDLVLKAERMPRIKLYGWLEARGWRWRSRGGWVKVAVRGKSVKPAPSRSITSSVGKPAITSVVDFSKLSADQLVQYIRDNPSAVRAKGVR